MNYRNVCLGMQRELQFVSRQHRERGNSDPAIWAVGLKLQRRPFNTVLEACRSVFRA
jgi:hypothetical protein